MSRVGKQPVKVPAGVKIEIKNGVFHAKGPKGALEQAIHPDMVVAYDEKGGVITVARPSDAKRHRALHGLTQRLVANVVTGVSAGFEKKLQIIGLGYNAKVQGAKLLLNVGFANTVELVVPKDLSVETPTITQINVRGCDKQRVGQFAADVRGIRPPEPYKGKGIRYEGEYVRRKAGKAFVSGQ
jgi:large subunit ribosomal protein L6